MNPTANQPDAWGSNVDAAEIARFNNWATVVRVCR